MATRKLIDMSKQDCNFCHTSGHRIHAMDAYGIYIKDENGNRVLACPILVEREAEKEAVWPQLSAEVQPRAEARELVRRQRVKEEKKRQQLVWQEKEAKKREHAKATEEMHVVAMEQKYGKFWHRMVAGTEEDCPTARGICADEEYEAMCDCDRHFQEDAEREREIQDEWDKEDKQREETRSTMSDAQKRQEKEEWEEKIEIAYDNAQIAQDYF